MPATSQDPIRIRPHQAPRPAIVSRVLVVQEDGDTQRALADVIARLGWDQDAVADSLAAWRALEGAGYDLVVIDVTSSRHEGLDLLTRLRLMPPHPQRDRKASVLVIGPAADPRLRLDAFNRGADGFIEQPMHADEARAVLCALARRRHPGGDPPLTARVGTQSVQLSARDSALLRTLMGAAPEVVSRAELRAALGLPQGSAIDVSVHLLRRKLGPAAVETVRGRGYQLGATLRLASMPAGA